MGQFYANIAREDADAFATAPADGWQGVAVPDLGDHQPVIVTHQSSSLYYGQQARSTRGRRTMERGGTGTIKPGLESAGHQTLFAAVFGEPEVTVLSPGEAWQYVWTSSLEPSTVSIAAQVGREFAAGGRDRDTYTGGQATEMRVEQGLTPRTSGTTDEGMGKLEFDFDYAKFAPGVAEHLPVYPDAEVPYTGQDWVLSVGATLASLEAECVNSWKYVHKTNLDLEAAACASSMTRDLAGRGAMSEMTVEMAWAYKGREYLDAWINGTPLAMRSLWQPAGVFLDAANTIAPKVQFDYAAVGFTGAPPEVSPTAVTRQTLPGEVLWNHVDPATKLTVVSSEPPYSDES